MKVKFLPFLVIMAVCLACNSTNTTITNSWKNKEALRKEKVKSVFIAVITPNKENRAMLETELAYRAKEKGLTAIKSYEVFKDVTKDNMPAHDDILQTIRNTKADAIFTITLRSSETLNTASGPKEPIPTKTISFYGYYSNVFPLVYDYNYYSPDKIYYLESRLFDTQTEELVWSAESETYNPANFESFVKGYTETLIKKLESDGLLEKR
jgi:hypothetical protein